MAVRTAIMPEMLLKCNYGPYFYLVVPDKTFGSQQEFCTSKITSAKEHTTN